VLIPGIVLVDLSIYGSDSLFFFEISPPCFLGMLHDKFGTKNWQRILLISDFVKDHYFVLLILHIRCKTMTNSDNLFLLNVWILEHILTT
jgi:hypothetical protein